MALANKLLTLVFVHDEVKNQLLLGYKKRGFGQGKWNGFGGKVEKKETILDGARRELHEEAGIHAVEPAHAAVIIFEFENDPQLLEVHVFRCTKWEGKVTESEEMKPAWFAVPEIPYASMWKDDQMWFPLMLTAQTFVGYFLFRGHDTCLTFALKQTPEIEFGKADWDQMRKSAVPFSEWEKAHAKDKLKETSTDEKAPATV